MSSSKISINSSLVITLSLSFIFTIAVIIKVHFFSFDVATHVHVNQTKLIPNKNIYDYNDDNNHNIHPFISNYSKSIAYEKFINGNANVRFFHSRKAAGTATEQWLSRLVNAQNIGNTFRRYEAYTIWNGKKSKNPINNLMTHNATDSIFAITFRHPIDRILSHYEFEWKWGCNACCRTNSDIIQQMRNDANDEYLNMNIENYLQLNMVEKWWEKDGGCKGLGVKYKFANIELEDLLRRIEKFDMNSNADAHSHFGINIYVNNYYLWMFCCDNKHCNIKKHFIDNGLIEECYENAISKIKSMDVIILSEWLSDIRTNVYVNHLFEAALKNKNIKDLEDSKFIKAKFKPYLHKEKTRGNNYMINEWSYNKLMEWNEWDLKLYAFVKQFVYHKTETNWDKNGGKLLFGTS